MFHDRPFPLGVLELANPENLLEDTVPSFPATEPSGNRADYSRALATSTRAVPPVGTTELPGARARTARTRSLWCRWKRIRRNHPGR